MNPIQALPPPPWSGMFWSVGVPSLLFVISLVATWLLYRHFARRQP
jgi:hypothetical protein